MGKKAAGPDWGDQQEAVLQSFVFTNRTWMSGWWSLGLGHSRDNYICNVFCNVSVPAEYHLVYQYLFMAYPAVLATASSSKLT